MSRGKHSTTTIATIDDDNDNKAKLAPDKESVGQLKDYLAYVNLNGLEDESNDFDESFFENIEQDKEALNFQKRVKPYPDQCIRYVFLSFIST